MINTSTPMSIEHFHDFYYLEALQANVGMEVSRNPQMQFSRTVEKLREDIENLYEDIVPNIAFRTFVYLYAACLGEARHARENSARDRFIVETKQRHRKELYSLISNYRPTKDNLNTLIRIFEQEWTSGFGGEPWLAIAKALKYYFTASPAAFIDHVIDLEHNNGTAFNKSDARDSIYFKTEYPGSLRDFLDYKFSKDILEKRFNRYPIGVTYPVWKLIQRYCNIFRKTKPDWVISGLRVLDEYQVSWSDGVLHEEEKWYAWTSCVENNRPTVEALIALSGLEDFYPPSNTAEQVQKALKKAKTKINKIAKGYMTKELRQGLDKKFAKWLEWALKRCKKEMCKVTYSVLPCKIQAQPDHLLVLFPVPFEKLGTPTEYGFKMVVENNFGVYGINPREAGYGDEIGKFADGYFTKEYGSIHLHTDNKLYVWNQDLEVILD